MGKNFLKISKIEYNKVRLVLINISTIEIIKISSSFDLYEIKIISSGNKFEYHYNNDNLELFDQTVLNLKNCIDLDKFIYIEKKYNIGDNDIKNTEILISKDCVSCFEYYPDNNYIVLYTINGLQLSYIYNDDIKNLIERFL